MVKHKILKSSKNASALKHVETFLFNFSDLREVSYESGEYIGETIERVLQTILYKYVNNHLSFFTYMLREVIRNVPEHSECDYCQLEIYLNDQDEIGFRIIDKGIGIMKSLMKNSLYSRINDNFSFIYLSLKPGVTKTVRHDLSIPKEWRNSGFGLYMISNLVKDMGRFEIKSKGAGLVHRNIFVERLTLDKIIPGTVVTLVIDLEKVPSTYKQVGFYSKLGNKSIKDSVIFSEYATYDTASKASTLITKT